LSVSAVIGADLIHSFYKEYAQAFSFLEIIAVSGKFGGHDPEFIFDFASRPLGEFGSCPQNLLVPCSIANAFHKAKCLPSNSIWIKTNELAPHRKK
jgi:hypothetical protein